MRRSAVADGKDSDSGRKDCSIVSGSKILEGVGTYVVVAVGTKSSHGRLMMALRGDTENTPLQHKLNALARLIVNLGFIAGLLLFIALMIKLFGQLGQNFPIQNASQNGLAFVSILIVAVTLIVLAAPKGLLLAVTLAFGKKRMIYEKLLVRVLGSRETMTNPSVVCTDKTGTLTQNVMTVVAGSVGVNAKFVRLLDQNAARTNAGATIGRKYHQDFSIDLTHLNTVLSPQLRNLFNEAICINSTAFQDVDPSDPDGKKHIFFGSKTETALLQFAKELNWRDYQEMRESARIVQVIPFSSERKVMGVAIQLHDGTYRVHFKGATEILAKKSKKHVVVREDGKYLDGIETKAIGKLAAENISRTFISYANQNLRTIALCYRDFSSWPPKGMQLDVQGDVPFADLVKDLTLIGIAGIEGLLGKCP